MPQRYNIMANLTNYNGEIIFYQKSVAVICDALIIDKVKP